LLLATLVSATSCALVTEQPSESGLSVAEQKLIGGVPLKSRLADAVGALGVYDPESTEENRGFFPVCTASLISRRSVLTAKHCIALVEDGFSLAFGIGFDGNDPREVVPIVAVEGAPGDEGGLSGFGRDVGVARLERRVSGIEPLAIGTLRDRDVGKTFVMMGYGDQDDGGPTGTRHVGLGELRAREGKILQLVYDTFEEFYEAHIGEPPPSDCTCVGGESEACVLTCELRAEYEETELEKGYEVLVNGTPGNAELCFGDSGGPLIGLRDGRLAVLGLALLSFGDGSGSCHDSKGAVYASFGPEVLRFIKDAR